MVLIHTDTDISNIYNLQKIYKQIQKFYLEIIGIELEDDYIKMKKENLNEENFRKLAELLTGLSAQCDKRGEFLQIMQNMDYEDSTELFSILTERISAYAESQDVSNNNILVQNNKEEENINSDEEENTGLYIKIENLELENVKLHEEIKNLNNKVTDLTKTSYSFELALKESEGKYQELINSLEQNKNEVNNNNYEDTVNLSIQLSELKGKLEAKEKHLQKIKEDKEKIVEDLKSKYDILAKESEHLKEKSIKYDVLKEKMEKFSMEEMNALKTKLINSERMINDQEEKIRKLKNFDTDKTKLLEKIKDLNFELSQEKDKNSDILKENNYFKDLIIQNENEIKFLKKRVESLKTSDEKEETEVYDTNKISLMDAEQEAEKKKYILELETKIKFFNNDKETTYKEKTDFEEKINNLSSQINEYKLELEKSKKKIEKYNKYKDEKHTFINKISDLMEKVHQHKLEIENLKLEKSKEKSELEANNIVKL